METRLEYLEGLLGDSAEKHDVLSKESGAHKDSVGSTSNRHSGRVTQILLIGCSLFVHGCRGAPPVFTVLNMIANLTSQVSN